MKARGIDFICYDVTDMERALAFYRDTLGFEVAFTYGDSWVELATEPITVALIGPPHSRPAKDSTGPTMAVAVDDVAKWVEELRAKGVTVIFGPENTPVCDVAMVFDPDGNRLMIHHRHDDTWG
ncbi:VOC family protein [Candidatus Poribacteria bacterium]|nr:VOC family protein [Candidatus Poribacteria bacterium]